MRAPKGLEGVVVSSTELTKVDGQAGLLIYRGYDVTQLAGIVPYESVAHLLWFGHLPSKEELHEIRQKLAVKRSLPELVQSFLKTAASSSEPLSVLQTAVSMLGGLDSSKETSTVESSMAITAQMPTIVAAYHRFRQGLKPVSPRADLEHTANYLYMLTGQVPSIEKSSALDSYFTLLADHSLGASTFVARVAASTLTDVYSAVVAAMSALKGPLHGGAPIYVWEMLQSIGKPERARPWLQDHMRKGDRIMGFGHRVYRTEDPRSRVLKSIARKVVDPELFHLASTVEQEARSLLREAHPERPLDTNVEFYSSLVLNAAGVPPPLFTSTFACARSVGWTAHVMEQVKDNRLFRPEAEYVGPVRESLVKEID